MLVMPTYAEEKASFARAVTAFMPNTPRIIAMPAAILHTGLRGRMMPSIAEPNTATMTTMLKDTASEADGIESERKPSTAG